MITNLIQGKKIPVYGDGKYVRDWLYVTDHCKAIDVVIRKGKSGETYLVGGMTKNTNNLTIARKIIDIFGLDKTWIKFVDDRAGHDRKYSVDWSKISKLGWKPDATFDQHLVKTVHWYKKNSWWWKPLKKESEAFYEKKKKHPKA
jgi:dTDP-glucose 4,6-dehydratase